MFCCCLTVTPDLAGELYSSHQGASRHGFSSAFHPLATECQENAKKFDPLEAINRWRTLLGPSKLFANIYLSSCAEFDEIKCKNLRQMFAVSDTRNFCHGSFDCHAFAQDVHKRYRRTEAHADVVGRFNERFILSLASCANCVVMDDCLNVLPILSPSKKWRQAGPGRLHLLQCAGWQVSICMAVVTMTVASVGFYSTNDGLFLPYTPFHSDTDNAGIILAQSIGNALIMLGFVERLALMDKLDTTLDEADKKWQLFNIIKDNTTNINYGAMVETNTDGSKRAPPPTNFLRPNENSNTTNINYGAMAETNLDGSKRVPPPTNFLRPNENSNTININYGAMAETNLDGSKRVPPPTNFLRPNENSNTININYGAMAETNLDGSKRAPPPVDHHTPTDAKDGAAECNLWSPTTADANIQNAAAATRSSRSRSKSGGRPNYKEEEEEFETPKKVYYHNEFGRFTTRAEWEERERTASGGRRRRVDSGVAGAAGAAQQDDQRERTASRGRRRRVDSGAAGVAAQQDDQRERTASGGRRRRVDSGAADRDPNGCPGKPGRPEVTDNDRTHVSIKWTPPTDTGRLPITHYCVQRVEGTKTGRWIKVNDDCAYTDERVQPQHGYEYRVVAVNREGRGKPSDPSELAWAKPKFEAPRFEFDGKEVRVRAGKPLDLAISYVGAPLPDIKWFKQDLEMSGGIQTTPAITRLYIPESARSDSGQCRIVATNEKGTAEARVLISVVERPGPPEGPIRYPTTTTRSITLSWRPPKDYGGVELSGYRIDYQRLGARDWQRVPENVTLPNYTVHNLRNGAQYKFRVFAVNMVGTSGPLNGEPVTAKDPFVYPDEFEEDVLF
ncbi:hypothetical protein niasHS_011364 [Heterodera schachtii]|uniref:Fibronectin type-III domain-containing protein n=1 Tax=Heterodera schachtii TaxID=97005 RepID=A0ABD2ILB3_HETSC